MTLILPLFLLLILSGCGAAHEHETEEAVSAHTTVALPSDSCEIVSSEETQESTKREGLFLRLCDASREISVCADTLISDHAAWSAADGTALILENCTDGEEQIVFLFSEKIGIQIDDWEKEESELLVLNADPDETVTARLSCPSGATLEAVGLSDGIYVHSEKGLAAAAAGKLGDSPVFVCGTIHMEELVLTRPIPVSVVNGGELSADTLSVCTAEHGDASVVSTGGVIRIGKLTADAPDCALSVDEAFLKTVDKSDPALRLLSLNGEDLSAYRLGGDAAVVLTGVVLRKNSNDLISRDIVYTVDGYVLHAEIACVASEKTLRNANLTVIGEHIASCVIEKNKTGSGVDLLCGSVYMRITDEDGRISRYRLETDYQPSQLPIVSVCTDSADAVITKDAYISASVSIDCTHADGFSSLPETPIQISGRGNSSWKWDKKPYKFKFAEKTEILGLTAAKKWVLIANYGDNTLLRNTVALAGAKVLDNLPYKTSLYPVDVFLNGEYLGVYSLGEQIEVKKGRVDLKNNDGKDDTGYLLEIGGTDETDILNVTCFSTELTRFVRIKEPEDELLTKSRVDFIRSYTEKADAAVKARAGYDEYIDIDSLIDWLILDELTYNLDSAFRRSCYLVKDAGGKLQLGPPWDFDLAFGNHWRTGDNCTGWACFYDHDDYIGDNWIHYLFKDESFVKRLRDRWNEIGKMLVDTMLAETDRYAALIAQSAKENFAVWDDLLGKKAVFQPESMAQHDTFEKQIEYLKTYIRTRADWISDNIKVIP